MPSGLAERILQRIDAGGPASISEYMALCLSDPEAGYYVSRDPFGSDGDFITAPEISQLFGEMIGAWLTDTFQRIGSPDPVCLVELGPGRGTLMSDILRVAALNPAFRKALTVYLVEISPVLMSRQEQTLAQSGADIVWLSQIADLPAGPLLVVANEFFDALPIRQFVGKNGNWQERLIGRGDDDELAYTLGPATLTSPLSAEDGNIIETSPASQAVMNEIASRIDTYGGAALVIDYGYTGPAVGETLQAVRGHNHVDPLACPGDADLTAHVDFGALRAACADTNTQCHGPMEQGTFLLSLGLLERAGRLGAGRDKETQKTISAAVERLASPEQMGSLFKVMAVTPPGIQPLPFSTD